MNCGGGGEIRILLDDIGEESERRTGRTEPENPKEAKHTEFNSNERGRSTLAQKIKHEPAKHNDLSLGDKEGR